MNPPPPELLFDSTANRPSPRRELQGPRPAALRVNQASHKIRKPPVAPPHPHPQHQHQHQPPPRAAPEAERQPVIIYAVSPKVIHTTVSDFMNLVQRLTGNATDEVASSSSAAGGSGAGNLSPAARLASIEQASPKGGQIRAHNQNDFEANWMGDFVNWDTEARAPGILSPAPATLPPISPGFFSPSVDPFTMGYNMFIPSPGTLFSAPMVSPSPSSDPFNQFFDF